ncbi:MAG: TIGR03087 family PEP-CTERM/XrtA system glycosyltransferase, partial [Burkholderiales bacterium]|nr:TIGR03087 family PEP-CTERM/XrtA system glycosyltransferase [Burkholderiales bacterium]
MAKLLYLAHRIPYPPDKGDKIATFNFLRHLAARHEVHLGAFVDAPEDWAHADRLKSYCADLKLVGIAPRRRRLWSARALLDGRSLTEAYYASAELQAWVDATMRERGIDAVLTYCSAMAPYVAAPRHAGVPRVTHFADVDSEKWNAYADTHRGLMSWVYRREARTLLALERAMSQAYDVTAVISDAEAELYRRLAPEAAARVRVIPNGVDTAYFDPDLVHESPYAAGAQTVVFVGAMDYWPNVDAVRWFAAEVLPLLQRTHPAAAFWIVGSKPAREVQQLAERSGVHVTGRVPDVRPYVAHAGAVVAPLRVARGTQNKVLEAYAMARRVVLTSAAANGLRPDPLVAADTHDEPQAQADAVARALAAPPRAAAAR